jgi:hypothetical protein
MDPIFSAAIEHVRVMQDRIADQEASIARHKTLREATTVAEQRLRLLKAALEEMRIQLAQLTPTEQQVAAPAWLLPLTAAARDEMPGAA